MPLVNGKSFGPYEIVAPLGAGGMGEVYRARDTMLCRDVALKILPVAFTTDPGRLSRFAREARLLASLNHPHIATLHGFEERDGIRALVMELIEGETLADRVRRGPVPLKEALGIARQIADALEVAHEKGIIHRDLKPANVKIGPDGRVKVLDFGVAKLEEGVAGAEPESIPSTVTLVGTTEGAVVGTAAYMSPEQARGEEVDRRTDTWAFGCVLYEMLSGKRAFTGDQRSEILASVLAREPDMTALPLDLPSAAHLLLRRCFEKDRHRRIGDVSAALALILDMLSAPGPQDRSVRRSWRGRLAVLATAAVMGGLGAGTVVWLVRRGEPPRVTRSLLAIEPFDRRAPPKPGDNRPSVARPDRTAIALSPDGRRLVFRARGDSVEQLFVRPLDRLEPTPIAGTEGADSPFFSPDGMWIGFWAHGELRRVPASGGPSTTITKVPGAGTLGASGTDAVPRIFGASWGEGDVIVFATRYGMWRVDPSGGRLEAISKVADGEYAHRFPQMLPGGDRLLFTLIKTVFRWDDAEIAVQSISTGERQILFGDGSDARYVPTGHIVFGRRGTLMAVRFDPVRGARTGVPVALVDSVMQAANMGSTEADSGAAQFAVSHNGILVYASGGIQPRNGSELVWVERNGAATPLPAERREYIAPRLAPDGRRLAVSTLRSPSGGARVWIHDLVRPSLVPLTTEQEPGAWNVWSPDGTRVVFTATSAAGQRNLFSKAPDGSGIAERLMTRERDQNPGSWSADGKIALVEVHPETGHDIWILDEGSSRRIEPFLTTRAEERYPTFSPDGRWLAYTSNESGREEVYVQRYPAQGRRVLVSASGGHSPAWSTTELFYVTHTPGISVMNAVPFTTAGSELSVGTPRRLFEGRYGITAPGRGYDVAPDGRRFLMVRSDEPPAREVFDLVMVQNWFDELKARVPVR